MAKNSRDVSLVIRARNEATKAVDAVTEALREITKASQDFKKGSTGTDSVLSAIGKEIGALNQAVQGSNAFDRLAQGAQRAETAVTRLQDDLQKTADENRRLAGEVQKTTAQVERLSAQADEAARDLEKQRAATQKLKAEQTQLRAEVRKTEQAQTRLSNADQRSAARLTTLSDRVAQAQQRYDALGQEMAQTEAPSKRLQASYEAAGRALERQLQAVAKAQQAQAENRNELAATSNRLTDLRSKLKGVENAYQTQAAAQERAKNTLAETRAQARGAQQNLTGLEQALAGSERRFNQVGQSLQKANSELKEVRQVTTEADAALAKMGTTVRTQLLRSLREAEGQLQSFRAAQAFGQGGLQRLAAQPGGRETAEFAQLAAQTRQAKQAAQEQQIVITRLRQELRAAGTDVNALNAAQQRFQQRTAAINAQVREAAASLNQQSRAAQRTGQAMDQASRSNQRFSNTLDLLRRNTRQTLSFFQRMRGEALSLATSYVGLYGAIAGTRGVATAYMTLEAVQNRLGAVFQQNTQRVGQEIDWLMAQADRLGISFQVLSNDYAKFAVASNAVGVESAATRQIFLSVAEAGRVNKLSMEQMSGIFLALEQMMSKNKIASEELRRQLGDRLPGAFAIMADALGMTTAELDEAMKKGQVFATQDNMLRFANQLDQRFGEQLPAALQSFTTQWGRLQNEIFKAQLRAGQGGIIGGLTEAMRSLTEYFQSADGQQFFNALSAAAGKFFEVLALIPPNFDLLVTLTAVFIGQRLARYLVALSADFASMRKNVQAGAGAQAALNAVQATGTVRARGLAGALTVMRAALVANLATARASVISFAAFARGLFTLRGAVVAVTGVMRILRAVLATLGGPIGLLITGVSILFANWLTSADEATQATAELERQVQQLRTAFAGAGEDSAEFEQALSKITQTQAEANLERLREGLEDGIDELGRRVGFWSTDIIPIAFGDRTFADLEPIKEAVETLERDLRRGVTPNFQAFRAELDRIAQSNPAVKDLVAEMLDLVDISKDGSSSVGDLADQFQRAADVLTLRVKPGTDEARKAMERLGLVTEEVTTKQVSAAERLDEAYEALAEKLRDPIENKRLEEVEELTSILRQFEQANKDAWTNADIDRYLDLVGKVQQAIRDVNQEAANSRVTGSLVDRIIGVESGGDPTARNPNSTATGLGQFIESTWLDMFRRYFPDRAESMSREAILALRTDAQISRQLVEAYAQENAQVLQRAGVAVNDAALYLSHFLGPQGALSVLQASPGTPVSQLLGADQIAANQSVLGGRNAGQVIAWAQQKVGITDQELSLQQRLAELDQKRVTKQKEFNESLAQANADREFQLDQARLEANNQQRQAAINEAIRNAEQQAARDNLELTKEQREEIERTTGALWDQQNAARLAAEERQQIEKRVNDLMQHRRDLIQAIEFAEGQGDQATAERLRTQLESITQQLNTAIAAARQFWMAQSGPEAQAALVALQNLENGIQDVGHSFLMTADQINQSAATMGADAFMDFAEALASGENAIDALGNAFRQFAADFLRMIARMIIQQAILNALQAAGFGGGVAGGIGALFHQGGTVTTSGAGRSVSAGWFANAVRYHTGGIAGLKPNEVPAILERGEEVLTDDDPRHRANGGAAPAAGGDVKIINAIDAGSFVSEGMNTTPGQKAVLNFIRANSGQIKNILGG